MVYIFVVEPFIPSVRLGVPNIYGRPCAAGQQCPEGSVNPTVCNQSYYCPELTADPNLCTGGKLNCLFTLLEN